MPHPITRRDFLNGVALSTAAGTIGLGIYHSCRQRAQVEAPLALPLSPETAGPDQAPDYYPPAHPGFRGDNTGSFEAAHELRKGVPWQQLGELTDTGEHYDLIVVGAGLSGLSAAHFYRQRLGQAARVLLIESHDDFGGHATRNEFEVDGHKLLAYGGSQSLASPGKFGDITKQLMQDLGIDVRVFHQAYDQKLQAKLGTGFFFDRETFGRDLLLTGMYQVPWAKFLANAPITPQLRREIVRIYTEKRDYLSELPLDQKIQLLKRISYADYLTQYCQLPAEGLRLFQSFPHNLFTVGIDAVSAWSCYHGVDDFGAFRYPGFDGLHLPPIEPGEPYIYHFPDGNASVARLLVRSLIPRAVPGNSMYDVVLARVDYAALDQPTSTMRIRLNSTVVNVRRAAPTKVSQNHPDPPPVSLPSAANSPVNSTPDASACVTGPTDAGGTNSSAAGPTGVAGASSSTAEPTAWDGVGGLEVVYLRNGGLHRVKARHCVLACHAAMIPYLCPELPQHQRQALSYLVRMPLVYTHVALRNWRSFAKLGIRHIVAPQGYHYFTTLDFPVSLGDYRFPSRPDEPAVLFMLRVPCRPGLSRRDQNRFGRWDLLNTPFATFEHKIRDQLGRMLAGTGFDPNRDICGITVNRWAHGYSFIRNRLFDPEWSDGSEPWVLGRRSWGAIAIANADAGASPYLETAVEQAHRAVNELFAKAVRN